VEPASAQSPDAEMIRPCGVYVRLCDEYNTGQHSEAEDEAIHARMLKVEDSIADMPPRTLAPCRGVPGRAAIRGAFRRLTAAPPAAAGGAFTAGFLYVIRNETKSNPQVIARTRLFPWHDDCLGIVRV
jgi:hypothetical protein